jgi:hypothetical protein
VASFDIGGFFAQLLPRPVMVVRGGTERQEVDEALRLAPSDPEARAIRQWLVGDGPLERR